MPTNENRISKSKLESWQQQTNHILKFEDVSIKHFAFFLVIRYGNQFASKVCTGIRRIQNKSLPESFKSALAKHLQAFYRRTLKLFSTGIKSQWRKQKTMV